VLLVSTQAPAAAIALHAVRSLHAELMLFPKPGLVSSIDNGSHDDMDAALFMRSLFSLRGYFKASAQAGMGGADFDRLKALGQAAEARMMRATGGINTHRGAIFCLGLLCAAAGRLVAAVSRAAGMPAAMSAPSAAALQATLRQHWGDALARHCLQRPLGAHGTRAALLHDVGGARAQAAAGMPAVFALALPALRATLAAGRSWECARIDAFFHLLATLDDSNVLYRGGAAGAGLVRSCGETFLKRGGTADPHWRATALHSHRLLVAHRLSPGGAADLLAATCFVHALTCGREPTAQADILAAPATLSSACT
jgi:triphosphoribosyl-dephospho-CoA synthase